MGCGIFLAVSLRGDLKQSSVTIQIFKVVETHLQVNKMLHWKINALSVCLSEKLLKFRKASFWIGFI